MNISNMIITKKYVSSLSNNHKEYMFRMYVQSYTLGGQELWFKNKEELFKRYPCVITFDNMHLIVYAMYQFKKKYNKISLVCHNGSEIGKKMSIELIYKLINKPGWILEASDKVSWLLRKRGAPIINDYESIIDALNIRDNRNDTIEINDSFNYNKQITFQYTRIYHDSINDKTYRSHETLFGIKPCNYNKNNNCSRQCLENNLNKNLLNVSDGGSKGKKLN